MIPYFLAQAGPDSAINVFHTLADRGPWALSVFLVLVQIVATYILFKWFAGRDDKREERHAAEMAVKDAQIKAFAAAWDRQTDAYNRRTRSDAARSELDALQFAGRRDLHEDMRHAATEVLKKIKDQSEEETAAVQR